MAPPGMNALFSSRRDHGPLFTMNAWSRARPERRRIAQQIEQQRFVAGPDLPQNKVSKIFPASMSRFSA
jgi:hypothetical protein